MSRNICHTVGDLYTKDNNIKTIESQEKELWAYYQPILEKYGMGGDLKW